MGPSYERYLDELHAGFATADDVIRAILADVSPAQMSRKRRIVAGEANEVYDIALADGRDVIVDRLAMLTLTHF